MEISKKKRESNIELLRLVSMLMVINVHTFSSPTGIDISAIETDSLIRIGLDFFREASSISCVNLFILISGYFTIKWKLKNIFSLIFQVYFWIFLIYIICLSFGYIRFTKYEFVKHLMGFMNGYWFIPSYMGLYVFAPILNSFTENHTVRQLSIYIVFFYLFFTIDASPFSTNYSNNGYSIYSFCGLYLIGQLIRKSDIINYHIFDSLRNVSIYIIITTLIIAISALLICIVFKRGGEELHMFPLSPIAYNNPLVILQSVLIFIFFLKLKIRNKIINWCAASALSLYLLHMHPDIKQTFYEYAGNLYTEPLAIQYLKVILTIIAILLFAVPIDKIRILVFERCYKLLHRLTSRKSNIE